jgi:hypothetical protein
MELWVRMKAIEVAGAAPTDKVAVCAARLREALAREECVETAGAVECE